MDKNSSSSAGVLETLKQRADSLAAHFSWDRIIHYSAIFVGGVVGGFVLRRFGNQLFYGIVGALCAAAIAYYFKIIVIDWTVLHASGLVTSSVEGTVQVYMHMIRLYMTEVITLTIGCILGYKMSA